MKRISDLECQVLKESVLRKSTVVYCSLQDEISHEVEPFAMSETVQRETRSIRTDLNDFTIEEMEVLVRRGYVTAKVAWQNSTKAIPPTSSERVWNVSTLLGYKEPVNPDKANLRSSKHLRFGIWSPKDWASWATAAVLCCALLLLLSPLGYQVCRRRQAEVDLEKKTEDLKIIGGEKDQESKEKINAQNVAAAETKLREQTLKDYKISQKSVSPGDFVFIGDNSGATQICCFVVIENRNGDSFKGFLTADVDLTEKNQFGDTVRFGLPTEKTRKGDETAIGYLGHFDVKIGSRIGGAFVFAKSVKFKANAYGIRDKMTEPRIGMLVETISPGGNPLRGKVTQIRGTQQISFPQGVETMEGFIVENLDDSVRVFSGAPIVDVATKEMVGMSYGSFGGSKQFAIPVSALMEKLEIKSLYPSK